MKKWTTFYYCVCAAIMVWFIGESIYYWNWTGFDLSMAPALGITVVYLITEQPKGGWLNKIFKLEEIKGQGDCPVYLERWHLLKAFGCSLYLHHFLDDDWAVDPHDHPRRFISIGLRGSYIEQTYKLENPYGTSAKFDGWGEVSYREKRYTAPWIRSFPAEHVHRIRMVTLGDLSYKEIPKLNRWQANNINKTEKGRAWTLVLVLWKSRDWGFVMKGRWVQWLEYIRNYGQERKSC